MAYSKGSATTLTSSTSLLPNNLSFLFGLEGDSTTFGVVHKGSVSIAHLASSVCTLLEVYFDEAKDNKNPASYVTGLKWCQLQSLRVVLVLTSYSGFQILDWNGSSQLYFDKFETPPGAFESRFARGIASVGNSVCVGTSEGPILMLSIPTHNGDIKFVHQLQGHSFPICDLASNSKGRLASCDESGVIIVWLDPLTCAESSTVINDSSLPCLSLCFWNSLLIGGFIDGLIKIYNCETAAKLVEIAAHARCINALDIAVQAGLLLSASEDNTVSVWKLPTDEKPTVHQVFSTDVPNSLLCGGRFCDPHGNKFSVTYFDSSEITNFSTSIKRNE